MFMATQNRLLSERDVSFLISADVNWFQLKATIDGARKRSTRVLLTDGSLASGDVVPRGKRNASAKLVFSVPADEYEVEAEATRVVMALQKRFDIEPRW